jgi:putative FmdB family regulatory protein
MPIYEYACITCGYHFERKQAVSEPPVSTCPQCGNTVRKVLHPVGIVFKGSGFYTTDYASPSRRSEEKGGREEKKESSSAGSEPSSSSE